jgi:hypothetical protein
MAFSARSSEVLTREISNWDATSDSRPGKLLSVT